MTKSEGKKETFFFPFPISRTPKTICGIARLWISESSRRDRLDYTKLYKINKILVKKEAIFFNQSLFGFKLNAFSFGTSENESLI